MSPYVTYHCGAYPQVPKAVHQALLHALQPDSEDEEGDDNSSEADTQGKRLWRQAVKALSRSRAVGTEAAAKAAAASVDGES